MGTPPINESVTSRLVDRGGVIAAPLFQVTRKDSGYKSGPLPPAALQSFKTNFDSIGYKKKIQKLIYIKKINLDIIKWEKITD